MQFKKIQNKISGQITSYFIDEKKVNAVTFEDQQQKLLSEGKRYNSSLTTGTRKNYIHTHSIN